MNPSFWSIDFGQVITVVSFIGGFFIVLRRLDRYGMEHEMLIDDFCARRGIDKTDLITRQKTGIIFRG